MSKAETHYPEDEFDVPNPDAARGVHRAPRSAWSRWWPFLAVLVIAPVVAYGLVVLVSNQEENPPTGSSQEDDPEVTDAATPPAEGETEGTGETIAAEPPAPPPANMAAPIEVLNAAQISGLATAQAEKLTGAGFTAVTSGNFSGTAPDDSVVYYATEDLAATAQLAASTLGITTVTLSAPDAGAGISVVLTSDPSS